MRTDGTTNGAAEAEVACEYLLRPRTLNVALMATTALLVVSTLQSPAQSQTRPAVTTASARPSFNIPAQPLSQALVQFSNASGVQVFVNAGVVSGINSPGASGALAPAAALNRLLAGTGLTYRFTNAHTVAIERPGASASGGATPAGAISLDTIDVEGAPRNDPGRTEGTGSYTPSVTATATRLQLSLRETPQSISVVTRQQIEDFRLVTTSDVIDHTPGITTVTNNNDRVEYYSRGFMVQNFQYDGMPTTYDISYPGNNTLRDMAMFDRIEVLKGATGLMTGVGDPGATINLIRKKPTKSFQGYTTLSVGSWDNYRGELDLSGQLNESGTVRGRFVTAHQDRKSYLDHFQDRSSIFYGIVEADLTPDTLLTIGADYQRNVPRGSSYGGIPIFNSLGNFNEVPRSFNPGARWSSWEQHAYNLFTTLEQHFDNEWLVKLQLNKLAYGQDRKRASASCGAPNPLDGTGVTLCRDYSIGDAQNNVAELYATGPIWLFDRKHELVLGSRISKVHRTNRYFQPDPSGPGLSTTIPDFYNWNGNAPEPRWIPSLSMPVPDNENFNESGFYAATRLQVHDRLKVLLGARVSNYESLRDTFQGREHFKKSGAITPYYGAILDLTDVLSAYASYTGIFRPQAAQNEQGSTLPPLEGTNTEVGLKAAFFDGRLNASAAYFDVKQDNFALVTGGVTPNGNPAFRPVDGVVTKGFELEISGQLSRQWQIQAGLTHKIARQDNIKVATYTPENQFTLYTTYKLDGALDGLTVGGGARWQDDVWDRFQFPQWSGNYQTVVVKSYWLADLMASYKFNDKLSATLNIRNLFDKKYYSFYQWYNTYTWGAPRSVFLSMTYKF